MTAEIPNVDSKLRFWMMAPEMVWPRRTPEASIMPQMERRVPRWWTKKRSETVDVTRVSRGAEAIPWMILMAASWGNECTDSIV